MVLSFEFWNDIKKAEISQRSSIVKKHCLTLNDIEIAGKILRDGTLEEEWFNQLYISCTVCGLRQAHYVFDKYGIAEEERENLMQMLHERWANECNKGKFNN